MSAATHLLLGTRAERVKHKEPTSHVPEHTPIRVGLSQVWRENLKYQVGLSTLAHTEGRNLYIGF